MELPKAGKLVAVLAAVGLLGLVLRGPVAASLEDPLVHLWWLVNSIPQQWIWGMLAVLGFIVAFSVGRAPRQEKPETTPPHTPSQTQLQRLSELIELAGTSQWARDVVGRRLSETAAGLRALREGTHRDDVREEIRTGRWPAHSHVRAVLQTKRESEDMESESYADALAGALDALERYAQGRSL